MICQKVFIVISVVSLKFEQVINNLDLHPVEDNAIITSEFKIRETLIDIIEMFNISTLFNVKLNKQLTIHNNLISTALIDQDYCKAIVRVSRLTINDISEDFIKSISEITKEDIEFNNEEIFYNNIIENITKDFLNELYNNKNVYGNDIYVQLVAGQEQTIMSTNLIDMLQSSEESNESQQDNDSTLENVTSFSNRRLYKGKKTKIEDYPFLAAILVLDKFYCSGAIVSEYLVITAASCLKETWSDKRFRENPAFLTVRVGSSSTSHDGNVIPVTEVNIHPTYDKNTLKGNLCLLKLSTKLKLTNKSERKIYFDGRMGHLSKKSGPITIVGWGNKNHHKPSKHLFYGNLKIISLKKCKKIYGELSLKSRRAFCARSSSTIKGSCEHDVGDPGLVDGILTGVVSVGSSTCGDSSSLTVFTKLGYFSKWIEGIIESAASESQKYTRTVPMTISTTEIPISERSIQYVEPIDENKLKSVLRKSKTVDGSNVFKDTNLPDSGQPAPIYIADGVKSILYNNEYNIYLVTEKPVGRQIVNSSTKIDSKESEQSSKEIPIFIPEIKTEVPGINESTESESTTHTTEDTHKTKRSKKHKSKSMKSHVTKKFTPNLLLNIDTVKDDVMNTSILVMDTMKHEKNNHKKHRGKSKHSKHTVSIFDKNLTSVQKSDHETTLSPNMKHVFNDLQQFLKSVTSEKLTKRSKEYNPDDSLKDFLQRITAPIKGFSLGETTTENEYGLPVSTTFRNSDLITTPNKLLNNPDLHQKKIHKHLHANNQITVLNLRHGTATHSMLKQSRSKDQTDNNEAANTKNHDKHINEENKANYDLIDSNDEEGNEFKTEELLNEYSQKAPPKTHSDSEENYDENDEITEQKILNRIYELTSQLRKSKSLTPKTNLRYRKSNSNGIVNPATLRFRRIANNFHYVDSTIRSDKVLSHDYIYSLIEKTVDEVEKELQNNDSLVTQTNQYATISDNTPTT